VALDSLSLPRLTLPDPNPGDNDTWVCMVMLAMIMAHCSDNYARMDETGNTLFRDYAHSFLSVLPQDARLIVKGTNELISA
jgi:hypothetical protein